MERLQLRVHDTAPPGAPTLVYLPGLHGDWTLVTSFRAAVHGRARFVECTYPRTLNWTLRDYAVAVQEALLLAGVRSGWLLGESFGSQIVWPLLELEQAAKPGTSFHTEGVVLAGGFVRHPWPAGVRIARFLLRAAPLAGMRWFLWIYTTYARFRHRHAPETAAAMHEFVARRTDQDRHAAAHRLQLIAEARPQRVAAACPVPVFYLAGAVDPLVPFPVVRRWLRRRCPNYQGGITLWRADHNVLATAPRAAADRILAWTRFRYPPAAPAGAA